MRSISTIVLTPLASTAEHVRTWSTTTSVPVPVYFTSALTFNVFTTIYCSSEEFQGDNCQYRIDDCAEDPCLFGTCFDGSNSYLCVCESGYNGTNCDQNIDDCEKVGQMFIRGLFTFLDCQTPCQNNGHCVDLINDVRCICQPGYDGKNCEIDIDECSKFKVCLTNVLL